MKVEIIFQCNANPAVYDADDVYTKGGLLCLRNKAENKVVKFPLCNIFSVRHIYHEDKETDES